MDIFIRASLIIVGPQKSCQNKKFIRKMNEFHFEQKFEGWGKRPIDMVRESDNRMLVSWTKEDDTEKKVIIDEYEWNGFISHLFNEFDIDMWSQEGEYKAHKLYLPDGRLFREVPKLDGGEWKVSIIGMDRKHEFKGMNRVPENWGKFIDFIDEVEDAIDLADPGENISI